MFFDSEFNFEESNKDMKMDNQNCNLEGTCSQVCECPRQRCCQRDIHHCIEHIVPINTKIINHHIYHHVFKPVYTCTEENICSEDCSSM